MKITAAVALSAISLATLTNAEVIKRHPHESLVQRRSGGMSQPGDYLSQAHANIESMLNAISPSSHSDSSAGSHQRNAAVSTHGSSSSSSSSHPSHASGRVAAIPQSQSQSQSSQSRSQSQSQSQSSQSSQSQSSQSSQSSSSAPSSEHAHSTQSSSSRSSSTSLPNSQLPSSPFFRNAMSSILNSSGFGWISAILGGNPYEYNNPSGTRLLARKPKLGLSWANGDSMNISDFTSPKVSWYYTWDDQPNMRHPPQNITFCPMLWGYKNVDSFRKNVLQNPNSTVNSGKCVMGMNEVNQKGQADMSPQEACELMRNYVVPLKREGYYVISPVTTNAPNGRQWMNQFRQTCSDVFNQMDAVAVHYYDTNATAFQQYVSDWYDAYNKPIWVTEYACQDFNGGPQCSQDQTNAFQLEMSRWFDRQNFVEAYAPFGVMQNMQGVDNSNRLVTDGQPNALFDSISNVP